MLTVHDNVITSYEVDFKNEELILNTRYYDSKRNVVIFSGHLTHLFHFVQRNSIIFEIEECSPDWFYEQEAKSIEASRDYGWPINYRKSDTKSELLNFILNNNYKVFEISASLGLCGWVIAKELAIREAEQTAPAKQ